MSDVYARQIFSAHASTMPEHIDASRAGCCERAQDSWIRGKKIYNCNGSHLAAPSGFRNRVSGMGGGRGNKEAKWLQPLASVASASLEIRGMRFNCTAPTRWPPLHIHQRKKSSLITK